MLLFFLEIIYPRVPGAIPPQDFLKTALPEDVLSLYAHYLVNLAIWAGGILVLAGLIYGGVLYLLSTGKPQRMVSAKEQVAAAFFGLLLLLSSFLILKTLSPQFINLKIPTLKQVQIPQKPNIPLPETTAINSSIEVEMPFARIIEAIFGNQRIIEIKNNVGASEEIANNLLNQSENLKEAASSCECEVLRPDPPCNHYGCQNCPPTECTCDPCKNVRGEIQNNEDKNKTEISNLEKEQIKTGGQISFLKDWLNRLKRAEKFIDECPLRSLTSLTQFYSKKDYFNKQKWLIRDIKFWDDINILYNDKYKIPTTDFATFYCSVSGTLEQEYPFSASEPEIENLSEEQAEEVLSESMACSKESPVGEIIDRAERTTQFLIDKLELLVVKDKELIEAVDKLQVSISQCSSKGCIPQCICISCGHNCSYCQEIGCFGEPCPLQAISNQFNEIQKIWQEITVIIGAIGNEVSENGGFGGGEGGGFGGGGAGGSWEGEEKKDADIATIVNKIIPAILWDLEWNVRKPMKECNNLFNCQQALGAIIPPENRVLRLCCQTKGPYNDCLNECYLEIGQEKYRKCLQDCLDKKGQELNDPDLPLCTHELNFYCCP